MGAAQHADKVGVVGSTIAALCCLGIPAVVSVVTSVGLGFLLNDAILLPLLLLSLALVVWGLFRGYRRHGRIGALALGVIASGTLFVFAYVAPSRPLAYVSIAGLILASVLNVFLARRKPEA